MYKFFVFALPLVLLLLSVEAFAPTKGPAAPSSTKLMAGFGGGAASKSKKGKKETYIKLKPKQQWDRYLDMKTEEKVNVAVRMKEDGEWLEVGRVKSKDNENIPLAVALQRAIIAEHAKRLHPLKVSNKKTCEWGYMDGDDWTLLDPKSLLEGASETTGVEKKIGFQGAPDPATGFYCVYDGGKIKLGDETSFNKGEYKGTTA